MYKRDKMYVVEGRTMQYLQFVMEKLYGDGSSLSADERRDLANGLNAHLTQNVVEYEEETK